MQILIVKLSSLGDVVQAMPVVADILAHCPQAQIDWVVEEAFAPLVARVQGIRHVIPLALRRWRKTWWRTATRHEFQQFCQQLQRNTYDAVIDCQGLTKSALVARQARLNQTGVRGSFANRSQSCGYEWPVKWLLEHNQTMPTRIHAVVRNRLLASKLLGYACEGAPSVMFRGVSKPFATFSSSDFENKGFAHLMFTHGTTRLDNEWPLASWQQLAAQLVQSGHYRLFLPHSNPHELAVCQGIKQQIGTAAHILPRMDLSQLLDVMAQCQGVIGVDSGLSHLAVALGLPHVQIFSQDRAWRAGPIDHPHQVSVGGAGAPSVEAVWQAWHTVKAALT